VVAATSARKLAFFASSYAVIFEFSSVILCRFIITHNTVATGVPNSRTRFHLSIDLYGLPP